MRKFILMLMVLFLATGVPVVQAQDDGQTGNESAGDDAGKPEEDDEPECD